ncbi:conserved protein of unknown function [Candidatus Methylocalor cossyra]|uniref:Tetratricopeptide repeat protein n=2 Tax=Candidatus Methylocalor cossyra TaxID=3108543 RepID=A0ABM9NF52_9GAMM
MPIPKQFLAGLEPVFWLSGTTELRFPVELHRPLADYFQHCITRQPSDLRSHVRRIFLAYEFESRADLYAALIDLFLALGRHGHPLRTRLLELAKPRLEEGQYAFLRQSLGTGLSISPACNVTGSLLSQGVAGHTNLIKPAPEAAPEAVRDPLLEAREYLEYCQLDEARELLERAVLAQPERRELHQELLDIYRLTRDKTNFAKMHHKLAGIAHPMPDAWQLLAESFRGSDG